MTSGEAHESPGDSEGQTERRALILTTAVVGALLGCDVLLNLLGWESLTRPFGVRLALLAAFIGGGRIVYLALLALLEGRVGADIALAFACVAAGLAGEYFVAAEVVFIALLGECLEASTLERAQRAIQKLLEYRPRTARPVARGAGDGGSSRVGRARRCATRPAGRAHRCRRIGAPRPDSRGPVDPDGRELAGRR